MAEISLSLKARSKVPIEAEAICPDKLAGKPLSEVASISIWEGNRRIKLGDFFEIHGSAGETPETTSIVLEGDLSGVKRIGREMTGGKILVKGSVGFYLGEEMSGGTVVVEGNAGSWAGACMSGGTIEIKGEAGDFLASGPRGSHRGMAGGSIVVHGSVGSEAGCWMEDGMIRVGGNIGIFAGIHLSGGTILIGGDAEGMIGAGMTGGRVVLLGRTPSILPSFLIDDIRPTVKVGEEKVTGPFYLFVGDVTEKGDGKIFVSKEKNEHLKIFEKYLP